jgi:hypothetical protein
MGTRRFTRLTNAFIKKWENHLAAVACWFAFYNFSAGFTNCCGDPGYGCRDRGPRMERAGTVSLSLCADGLRLSAWL